MNNYYGNPLYNSDISYPHKVRNDTILQAFFENVVSNNISKKVLVYLNFPNEIKEISGIIEQIGNDYIILSDPLSNNWCLIPIRNINYISFEEKINYITSK